MVRNWATIIVMADGLLPSQFPTFTSFMFACSRYPLEIKENIQIGNKRQLVGLTWTKHPVFLTSYLVSDLFLIFFFDGFPMFSFCLLTFVQIPAWCLQIFNFPG